MIINDSFCYWDCQTMEDTCIIIFNMCMACVLLFFVVRTFVRARRVLKPGVYKFYLLMMLWGVRNDVIYVVFLAKDTFGILIFFKDYWPNRWHLT